MKYVALVYTKVSDRDLAAPHEHAPKLTAIGVSGILPVFDTLEDLIKMYGEETPYITLEVPEKSE